MTRSAPRSRSRSKASRSPATWAARPTVRSGSPASYENPKYLDKLVETLGADSIPDYEKRCNAAAALAFSEPEKSRRIKGIIEAAYDHGADMIVTPCPVCQMNVEVYQDQINATHGTSSRCRWSTTRR